MKKLIVASVLITASMLAMAKLPALSDDAKAKAAETAAKAAWTGKVGAYLSCVAQNKVADHYYKTAQAANRDVKPPQATPPCVEPSVFVYTPVEEVKPLEAAGAHSPATTATSPPSSTVPAAAVDPEKKP